MNIRKILRIVVVIGWIVVLVFVCFDVIIWLSVFFPSPRGENKGEELEIYRKYTLNIRTNETHHGYVTIPKHLEQEEYISYVDRDENLVLVYNFGVSKYVCSGHCYCVSEEDEEYDSRRSSSSSRKFLGSLTYLVAAFASTTAYQKARTFFEEECEYQLDEFCSPPNERITHIVERCTKVQPYELPAPEVQKLNDKSYEKYSEKPVFYEDLDDYDPLQPNDRREVFSCSGRCYIREHPVHPFVRDFCVLHKLSHIPVTVHYRGFLRLSQVTFKAELGFLKNSLEPYCYSLKFIPTGEEYKTFLPHMVDHYYGRSYCAPDDLNSGEVKGFDNIQCVI